MHAKWLDSKGRDHSACTNGSRLLLNTQTDEKSWESVQLAGVGSSSSLILIHQLLDLRLQLLDCARGFRGAFITKTAQSHCLINARLDFTEPTHVDEAHDLLGIVFFLRTYILRRQAIQAGTTLPTGMACT